jgi:hypothetical protein
MFISDGMRMMTISVMTMLEATISAIIVTVVINLDSTTSVMTLSTITMFERTMLVVIVQRTNVTEIAISAMMAACIAMTLSGVASDLPHQLSAHQYGQVITDMVILRPICSVVSPHVEFGHLTVSVVN